MNNERQSEVENHVDGTFTLTLKYPISKKVKQADGSLADQVIECIKFRQPALGDLRALSNQGDMNDLQMAVFFIERLTKETSDVTDQIQGEDMYAFMEELEKCMGKSQAI